MSKKFATREFYLSCWLYAQGIKLIEIREIGGTSKKEFIFEDSPQREKLVKEYWDKTGSIAPKILVDAIKDLKNRMYSNS